MEYVVRDIAGKFEVGGGFVFFGEGFAKRGVRTNPLGYGPVYNLYIRLRNTEQHSHTVLGSIDNL